MGFWGALTGKDLRESDAFWAKVREEQNALIHEVEAEGNYRTFLASNPARTWICRACGSVVVDRELHDAWHLAQG